VKKENGKKGRSLHLLKLLGKVFPVLGHFLERRRKKAQGGGESGSTGTVKKKKKKKGRLGGEKKKPARGKENLYLRGALCGDDLREKKMTKELYGREKENQGEVALLSGLEKRTLHITRNQERESVMERETRWEISSLEIFRFLVGHRWSGESKKFDRLFPKGRDQYQKKPAFCQGKLRGGEAHPNTEDASALSLPERAGTKKNWCEKMENNFPETSTRIPMTKRRAWDTEGRTREILLPGSPKKGTTEEVGRQAG